MKLRLITAAIATALMSTATYADEKKSDDNEIQVKTKGGLEVKTADGKYSMKVGGRIQWDYNHSELNGVTDEDDFNIRRARIYASGVIDDWSYKAQFNIGNNNGGTPEDLYIQYNGWGKAAKLAVGKQRVVFGLEDWESSNDITALERSGITEQYGVQRQDSVRLHGEIADMTYYSVSAFEDDAATGTDDFGLAARVAYVPFMDDDMLIHLGLGYTDRGDRREAMGLEFAANFGSFHLQAEYFDEEQGNDDRDGYYVQAGYILTGETRPYKDGKFKRVKPGKDGAWEIFARMEEGDGNHSDIELGRVDASAYTLGVNWYINNNVRLGMNYSSGDSNEPGSNDDGEEFRVRLQLTF